MPSTPTKLNAKKPRSSPQPDQPAITALFRHIPQQLEEAPGVTIPDIREEHVRPSTPPNEPVTSKTRRRCTPPPNYRLHVSDTKTRKHNSMPSDDDTLSSKLQLMLYHRLLSNLLVRPSRTTTGLDFGQFWVRLGLDPKRTLSKTFLVQAGLVSPEEDPQTALLKCLEDLVGAWRIAVDTLHVDGIDQTLSVVYRTQPKRGSRKKARSPGSSPSPSDQEKADLARAIAASLQDTDSNQDGDDLAKAIEASLKNDNTNSGNAPSDPEEVLVVDDAQTKKPSGAVATSSIQHHPQEDGQKEEGDRDTEESEESLGEGSVIIGKKPVQLDDALLDYHLSNVLDWWFGRRPPRGVDIRHTRRCM